MTVYAHLTLEERYQIEMALGSLWSRSRIARQLGRSRSTIDREIERNCGPRGYRAESAHALACARLRRRAQANARHIPAELWARVQQHLRQGWSPELTAGRLALSGQGRISHETIYLRVYAQKRSGDDLWRSLPCQRPRRRRRGANRARRHLIPHRVGIEQRPPIVDRRTRFGDWEGDTVVDGTHRQALVSLVERRSMFLVLAKVPQRTSARVCQAIIQGLKPLPRRAHTLTLDNGPEFCAHPDITQALGTRCYFADPYCAWQRGLNENHNGLIRRYIPKGSSLANYTQADIDRIAHALNHRPRKRLGFLTPFESFMGHSPLKSRALRT